jgi:outer membrane lipoprotein carrier protein
MRILKYLSLFIIIFLPYELFAQDAQEIIKQVQNKYDGINDAKATFSMTDKASKGKSSSASGTLWIQKENKYKIKTSSFTLITDGSTSWSYTPSKKQVVIDYYKDDGNSFSPNKYLFNYPQNFYSEYSADETVSGKECYVLSLTPRNKGGIKSAKVWVDKSDYVIRKVSISTRELTRTYTLKSITLNPGLSLSEFSFSAPSGVEVIDLR